MPRTNPQLQLTLPLQYQIKNTTSTRRRADLAAQSQAPDQRGPRGRPPPQGRPRPAPRCPALFPLLPGWQALQLFQQAALAAPRYSSASGPSREAARVGAEAPGEASRGPRTVGGRAGACEPRCGAEGAGAPHSPSALQRFVLLPRLLQRLLQLPHLRGRVHLGVSVLHPGPAVSAAHTSRSARVRQGQARRQGPPIPGSVAPLAPEKSAQPRGSGVGGGGAKIRPLPPSSLRPATSRGAAPLVASESRVGVAAGGRRDKPAASSRRGGASCVRGRGLGRKGRMCTAGGSETPPGLRRKAAEGREVSGR
ncbi:uncharacterized protein LOC116540393 [Sapajus apella]|uniref:Uncharacterized protein LOC116540393 n=1 Tax=Sapajus apella TaxID=9515 RepID=A0A6J3GPI7_SAPAP|nr:uncharacterized protein LOC116540393 [Sapajus apella]